MKIIGTGSAHPSFVLTNDMFTSFLDTSDEWITTRTGIKKRQIITSEHLEDLAAAAAENALENAKLKATDIDFVICSNVVNEYVTPGMGCIVNGKLGIECPSIDINCACAGFVYALQIANSFIETMPNLRNILVLAAEEPTRMMDWSKRDTCVLFGDGAGAVIVTKGNDFKAFCTRSVSKTPSLYQLRRLQPNPFINKEEPDGAVMMKGQDVFKLAVKYSLKDINSVLKQADCDPDEVAFYLMHQANIRIISTIRESLGLDESKFPHNIQKYGNTSSASVAILLDDLNREGKIKKGDKLIFSAFGAGFTTGACMLEWSKETIDNN